MTTTEFKIIEEPQKPLSMNPKKFALWLFLASVVMLFAGWTSAYIVREAEGNWVYFELPQLFYVTSGIVILSSITLQLAYRAAKKDDLQKVKLWIVLTAVLGVAFLVGQFLAWQDLVVSSVHLVGNPSGSFLYIITGFHALHVVSAVVFLFVVLGATFKFKVHSQRLSQMEMCLTYWHFLSVLWLYLFVFLLMTR